MFNRERKQLLTDIERRQEDDKQEIDNVSKEEPAASNASSATGAVLAVIMLFVIWRAGLAIYGNFVSHEQQIKAFCIKCGEPRIITVDLKRSSPERVKELLLQQGRSPETESQSSDMADQMMVEPDPDMSRMIRCLKCGTLLQTAP